MCFINEIIYIQLCIALTEFLFSNISILTKKCVEHKKNTKTKCGTQVDGFAIKLLDDVWNTAYPAIPNRFAIFGMGAARGRHLPWRGARLREEKDTDYGSGTGSSDGTVCCAEICCMAAAKIGEIFWWWVCSTVLRSGWAE